MRFTEIESISLEDSLTAMGHDVVIKRVVHDPALTDDQNFYNEIVLEDKPPFSFYENIMKEHHNKLKKVRKKELRATMRNRGEHAVLRRGVVYTKATGIINEMVETDNEVEVLKIIAEIEEMEANELESETIAHGRAIRKLSEDTLDYIAGLNMTKTSAEVDQIEVEFAKVAQALAAKRPGKALKQLKKINHVDTIISEHEYNTISAYIQRELNGL